MEAGTPLLDRIVARARTRGMNLVGAVDAQAFDATQPVGRRAREWRDSAGTILLLGTGGRSGWQALQERQGGPPETPSPHQHPIDDWSAEVAQDLLTLMQEQGVRGCLVQPDAPQALNFRQLAEMVGFGTISPVIGHLIHPDFGPWVSLRAALVLDASPFGPQPPSPTHEFQPCCACDRPCVKVCPAGTYDAGKLDLVSCGTHRVGGGCSQGCESLRSCPVGAEHRYSPEEEAFRHAYSLFGIRRWLGAGKWRFVPFFLRRRFR